MRRVLILLVLLTAACSSAAASPEPPRHPEVLAPQISFGHETARGAATAQQFADAVHFNEVIRYSQAFNEAQAAAAQEQEMLRGPVHSVASNGAFLDCVRQRESSGDYAVSTNPSYRGAYQFGFQTWDNTAAHTGRVDLIGKDPSTVAPTDQDAMAQALLDWQGTAPWAGGNYSC